MASSNPDAPRSNFPSEWRNVIKLGEGLDSELSTEITEHFPDLAKLVDSTIPLELENCSVDLHFVFGDVGQAFSFIDDSRFFSVFPIAAIFASSESADPVFCSSFVSRLIRFHESNRLVWHQAYAELGQNSRVELVGHLLRAVENGWSEFGEKRVSRWKARIAKLFV